MEELTEQEQVILFLSTAITQYPEVTGEKLSQASISALNYIEAMTEDEKRSIIVEAIDLVKDFRQSCIYVIVDED